MFHVVISSRHNIRTLWNLVASECGTMQEVGQIKQLFSIITSYGLLDNYVHRLVQTKAGGKLVEVSGSAEEVSIYSILSMVSIN